MNFDGLALFLATDISGCVTHHASLADLFGNMALTVPTLREALAASLTGERLHLEVFAYVVDGIAELGEGNVAPHAG